MESFKNCGLNTSTGWKVLKISVLKANLPNRATGASIKQARVLIKRVFVNSLKTPPGTLHESR